MHAGRVAQGRRGRHHWQELLVPGGEGLHDPELGHVRGPLQDSGPLHVGGRRRRPRRRWREARRRRPGKSRDPVPRNEAQATQLHHGRRTAPRRVARISLLSGPCLISWPRCQDILPDTTLSRCGDTPEGLAGLAIRYPGTDDVSSMLYFHDTSSSGDPRKDSAACTRRPALRSPFTHCSPSGGARAGSTGPTSLAEEALTALLEAARWAPSAQNSQPWRFLVTRRGEQAVAGSWLPLPPATRPGPGRPARWS